MRAKGARSRYLDLDLAAPVRLDLWALALALGVVVGTVMPVVATTLLLAAGLLSLLTVLWRSVLPQEWRLMGIMLPLFVAGGVGISYIHASAEDPLAELAALEPGEVVAVGRISSPVAPAAFGERVELQVEQLWFADREVIRGGKLQVQAFDLQGGVGDRVRVDGEISATRSDGEFDYARFLRTRGVSAEVRASGVWPVDDGRGWVGTVHRRTDTALSMGMRPEQTSVVRGMLLGDRTRIPEEMRDDFRRSGIAHILAISGMHVGVLVAAIYFSLRMLAVPLVARNLATLGLLWTYVTVAGAPPSAVRAGVIASLVLLAPLLKRGLSPVHFMTAMLALVLAWNPVLVYSTGFQLSVAAVFGILFFREPLQVFLKRTLLRPLPTEQRVLSNLMAISLAAQTATAPIIAASFGEVSIVGVATNLIAVPLAAPILTLGLAASVLGNVIPALAYPANAVNGFLVSILQGTAEFMAAFPFAAIETEGVRLVAVVLFYSGCLAAALARSRLPEDRWPWVGGLLVSWSALWLALMTL